MNILYLLLLTPIFGFDCIDDNGNSVDYWVALKKPKSLSYFYYDSNENIFNISQHSLNDTIHGALAHTTKQLWNNDANYVIYNDQIPNIYNNFKINKTISKFGHTKGYFAFNNMDRGFIISHSIPLFPLGPTDTDKYIGLGSNAFTYGQNIMCLSIMADVINEIANKFMLNRPQIYDMKLTTDKYENIRNLIDGKYSKLKLCESEQFITHSGLLFTVFSKTAEWNNDLYAGCVTPTEKDTLLVQSWIRGSAEGPVCPISDYDTLDIKYLDFGSDGSWSDTMDHSKWAITLNKNVVCMGDINRMTTQYLRGGGTICISDNILHSVLKRAIITTNSCLI